jgi:hypothetical protein
VAKPYREIDFGVRIAVGEMVAIDSIMLACAEIFEHAATRNGGFEEEEEIIAHGCWT